MCSYLYNHGCAEAPPPPTRFFLSTAQDDCTPKSELLFDVAKVAGTTCELTRWAVTATDKCGNSRAITVTLPFDSASATLK